MKEQLSFFPNKLTLSVRGLSNRMRVVCLVLLHEHIHSMPCLGVNVLMKEQLSFFPNKLTLSVRGLSNRMRVVCLVLLINLQTEHKHMQTYNHVGRGFGIHITVP